MKQTETGFSGDTSNAMIAIQKLPGQSTQMQLYQIKKKDVMKRH